MKFIGKEPKLSNYICFNSNIITLSKPFTRDKVFGEEGKKIQLHFFVPT
jgi:hypothetical protein